MFVAVLAEVRRIVRELDPALLSGTDAVLLMTQFDELENLAAGAKALLAARAVETNQWRDEGDRSPEHWLARKTGAYVGAARDLLDTAERLKELPATEQALRDGVLSVQQASVVAKGASVDPAAEQQLLDTASGSSLRELERQVDRVIAAKRSADAEREREDQIRRNRSLRVIDLPDGSAELRARGNKTDVAMLRARLQPWIDEQFQLARTEDRHEPVEAYGFDALVAMTAAAETGSGIAKSPAKVLVRVDLSALRRGTTEPGEVCEIAGFGSIPVSEALKVMPDALVAIVCTDGKPVNVTHLGRKFTAHEETALEWHNPECEVLGCYCTSRLEKDHNTDYAKRRTTNGSDASRLCHFHHRLKTLGWHLEAGTGKRRLLPPQRAPAAAAA